MDKTEATKLISTINNLVKAETEKNKTLDKIQTTMDKILNQLNDIKGKMGTDALR